MFDLNGKCALVTGASGGIGGAIAKALHQQGAKLVLSGTRQESLEALAKELGNNVAIVPCNLDDATATENLWPTAEEKFGQIDILVNNAGLTKDTLSMRMKDEDWQNVLDVNLTAGFRLARAAVVMQATGIVMGWGAAQYPYLIVPDLTIQASAAPLWTLRLLLLALGLGTVLLVPSLLVLFRTFKTRT